MNSIRKWLYKPKKTDQSLLAQFFYADEDLNKVAAELDSFDGRKDPDRCTALVNHLRQCQDKVLNICQMIMDEVILEDRASRDFRAKFPDDVLQENLAGQLWFGAECLAAGSSILNRELESATMRPLAKALTKSLENVRNLLREQCFRNPPEFTEKICESLKILDRLFAEFELSYVSAMVPVKTVHEYEAQQAITVLFSETLQRALHLKLLVQDQVDSCDPALMFTIPRLAIVAGLLIFPDGPLCLNQGGYESDLFRPFRSLLLKIRELLWTLSRTELTALERALCSVDEPSLERPMLEESNHNNTSSAGDPCNHHQNHSQYQSPPPRHHHRHHHHHHHQLLQQSGVVSYMAEVPIVGSHAIHDYVDQLFKDFPSCKEFISDICCNNNNTNHNNNNNNNNNNDDTSTMSMSQYSMNQTSGLIDSSHLDFQNDFQTIVATPNANTNTNSSNSYSDSSYSSFGENTVEHHSNCNHNDDDEEEEDTKIDKKHVDEDEEEEEEEVEIDECRVTSEDSGTEDTVKDLIQFMDKSESPCMSMNVREDEDDDDNESDITRVVAIKSKSNLNNNNSTGKLRSVYGASNSFSYDDRETHHNNSHAHTEIKSTENLARSNSSSSSSSCCSLEEEEEKVEDERNKKIKTRSTDFPQTKSCKSKLNLSNRSFSYGEDLPTPIVEVKASLVESSSKLNSLRSSSSSHDSGLSSMAETATTTMADKSLSSSSSCCLNGNSSDTSNNNDNNNHSISISSSNTNPENSSSSSSSSTSCLVSTEITSTSPITSENHSSSVGNAAMSLVNVNNHLKPHSFLQVPDHHQGMIEVQRRGIRNSNSQPTSEMFSCSGSCCNSECSSTSIGGESTCETSSFDSECQDDIEIALAMQAAEIATRETRNEARSRFKNSADLIHRLFICISGVADQLQTNHPQDLRSTLKCVFAMNATPSEEPSIIPVLNDSLDDVTPEPSLDEENMQSVEEHQHSHQIHVDNSHHHQQQTYGHTVMWIPDELAPLCMSCQSAFTFFHRRHHCRNCGGVFCNTCSDYVLTLPLSPKPSRVCSACYNSLLSDNRLS